MVVSSVPFVTASTDGGASEDGTGDSQQSIQNYTVYSPPYDLPGTGWTDKDGFANATWATNSSRGYIGCGVDGSGAYLGQGEAAAMQPLEVKVGRGKKITVDANLSYLCGDDIGEISKIWKHFDYETSVLDPWFEWAEALPILIKIGAIITGITGLHFLAIPLAIADYGLTLLEFAELAGEENLSTTHVKFSYTAYPGDDGFIRVGLQSKAFYGGEAFAGGYVKQITVYGIAPPPKPTIDTVGDQPRDTETPYTFSLESIDPNNDPVKYEIDWGDGTSMTTDFNITGEPAVEATHSYAETGYYAIKVKAIDCDGMQSDIASKTIYIWNHKPVVDELWVASSFFDSGWRTIGDIEALPRYVPYLYEAQGYDEDGDKLNYTVRFIDDKTYRSNLIDYGFEFTHTFSETGTRHISVMCWDEHGTESKGNVFSIFVNPLIMNPSPPSGATIYTTATSSDATQQDSTTSETADSTDSTQSVETSPDTSTDSTSTTSDSTATTSESVCPSASACLDSMMIDTTTSDTSTTESTTTASDEPSQSSSTSNIQLSWDGAPDGYNMTYKIYFGAGSPSTLIGTTESCSYYHSDDLSTGTYYWKVIGEDEYGNTVEGPTWHFTVSDENNDSDSTSSDGDVASGGTSNEEEQSATL